MQLQGRVALELEARNNEEQHYDPRIEACGERDRAYLTDIFLVR